MLLWISIFGGLLIMMGQHDRSEALFYYFRLEDQVPESHLLRLIEKHISFEFVREQLKDSYSETGRPSIDPELLLLILLLRRLLREPLGYRSGLKFTLLVVKAQTDHPITVLNLIGIDVIDLLAAVLLAGESGRAVVVNDLLVKAGGAPGTHG